MRSLAWLKTLDKCWCEETYEQFFGEIAGPRHIPDLTPVAAAAEILLLVAKKYAPMGLDADCSGSSRPRFIGAGLAKAGWLRATSGDRTCLDGRIAG